MANSADPDQLASSEANWSGPTLFAKAGYIWVQQDKGWQELKKHPCTEKLLLLIVDIIFPDKMSIQMNIILNSPWKHTCCGYSWEAPH